VSALAAWFRGLLERLGIRKATPAAPQEPERPRTPGLTCPRCGHRIRVSMDMLLDPHPIVCASCSLALRVNQSESAACLAQVRKLRDAVRKAEAAQRHAGVHHPARAADG
jgi:transcription elongation factor Elf1